MSYTLRLLTEAARDLVIEALRAESDKRTRVARGAAQHVAADKASGTKDVRAASVRVAMLLAEAGTLADLADELSRAEDVPLVERTTADVLLDATNLGIVDVDLEAAEELATNLGVPLADVIPDPDSDDGLSEAAHAAMARAEEYAATELRDADDPAVDTGAINEDDDATTDVDPALKEALG